jgi:hypothetical protein
MGVCSRVVMASQRAAADLRVDVDRASRSRFLGWQCSARRARVDSAAAVPAASSDLAGSRMSRIDPIIYGQLHAWTRTF